MAKKPTLAKLTRPKLHNVLARERLFALLDRCLPHAVIWICGPPGAGKTALAASYLDAHKPKVSGISLMPVITRLDPILFV